MTTARENFRTKYKFILFSFCFIFSIKVIKVIHSVGLSLILNS